MKKEWHGRTYYLRCTLYSHLTLFLGLFDPSPKTFIDIEGESSANIPRTARVILKYGRVLAGGGQRVDAIVHLLPPSILCIMGRTLLLICDSPHLHSPQHEAPKAQECRHCRPLLLLLRGLWQRQWRGDHRRNLPMGGQRRGVNPSRDWRHLSPPIPPNSSSQ
jgi:hypothetical protein